MGIRRGCIIFILVAQFAFAAEKGDFIATANEERVLRIGLVDCITYIVQNNSSVKIKRLEPEIAEQDIRIARSGFLPVLELEYNLLDNTKPAASLLSGADTIEIRNIDLNADMAGKFYTGTKYTVEFINNRLKSNSEFQTINPAYESQARITIVQPLFKGSGIVVNKADIILAVNKKNISINDLIAELMREITQVKDIYYQYLFSVENYRISRLSLKRARDLEGIIRERYKKGISSSVELLEAEAAVANREQAGIEAFSLREDTEDNLKLITNLVDNPELWNARIEPLDSPEFQKIDLDLAKSLVTAFNNRPDYRSGRITLEDMDLQIKVAGNNLWPALDLVGSLGANGLGDSFSEDWDKLISGDYPEWSVGVRFSYPWLNAGNKAAYEKARMEKIQALINFKRLEQNVILDVRNKVRGVETNYRKLIASRRYKQVQQKNFSSQRKRFIAGEISTHDLLDYEEDLASAQVGYIRALVEYNIAIARLHEAEGVTLARNNVEFEENI